MYDDIAANASSYEVTTLRRYRNVIIDMSHFYRAAWNADAVLR